MVATILAALVFGPAIIVWLLRANGALAFLSLTAGYAAFNYSNADIVSAFGQLHTSVNTSLVSLAVVLLPPVLTLVATYKKIKRSKRIFHLIPALGCGGLLALTAVPLLTDAVAGNFYSSSIWTDLTTYQSAIVGIGALASLLVLWYTSVNSGSDKKSKD